MPAAPENHALHQPHAVHAAELRMKSTLHAARRHATGKCWVQERGGGGERGGGKGSGGDHMPKGLSTPKKTGISW